MAQPIRLISVIILSCTLFFQVACSDEEKKVQDYLQRGETYFSQGDYKSAILEYRNAVKISPKNAKGRYKLGLTYLEIKEYNKAFQELQRAASLDPGNTDANRKVAEIYLVTKNYQEAEKPIENILSQNPSDIQGLMLKSELYIGKKEFTAALDTLDSVLKIDPKHIKARQVKAHVYILTKQFAKAEEELNRAISLDEAEIDIHKQLILFYLVQGRMDDLEGHLKKMTTRFPDSIEAKLGLAVVHLQQNDRKQAETLMEEALEMPEANLSAYMFAYQHFQATSQNKKAEEVLYKALDNVEDKDLINSTLADFYFEQGDYSGAKRVIEQLFAEQSDAPRARLVQAKLWIHEKKMAKAQELIESMLEEYPRWGELYLVKSIIDSFNGQSSSALKAAEQAVQYAPNNYRTHHQLAQQYNLNNEYDLAVKEALAAIKLMPTNWKPPMTLAKSLMGAERYGEAIKVLNELYASMPANTEVLFLLGTAHLALEEDDLARENFRNALSINPELTPALFWLVQLERKTGSFETASLFLEKHSKRTNNPEHITMLGGLYFEGKQYEKALQVMNDLKSVNPDRVETNLLLARIYLATGDYQKAADEYQSALQTEPSNTKALLGRALLLEKEGKKNEARPLYEKVLESNPGSIYAANNLALIHAADNGDIGLALYYAKNAKGNAPDDPYIADTLGWIYYKRGSYQLALNELRQAAEKLPDNEEVQEHYRLVKKELEKSETNSQASQPEDIDLGGSLSIGEIQEDVTQ